LCAGKRDVKKAGAPPECELLGRLAFFHKSGGEFERAGRSLAGNFLGIDAQKTKLEEIQAFCAVDGHELHGVPGRVVFEA